MISTLPADTNGSNVLDAGDIVAVTIRVAAGTVTNLTGVSISTPGPGGVGSFVVPDSLAVRGNPVTSAADGDSGELFPGGVVFRPGTVAQGDPVVVQFAVQIGSHLPQNIENPVFTLTTSVTASVGADTWTTSATSAGFNVSQRVADLVAGISVAPNGDDFIVTVENRGPSVIPNPRVTITLPGGVDLVVLPTDNSCSQAQLIVNCSFASLGAQANRNLSFTFRSSLGPTGVVAVTATSSVYDQNQGNNSTTSLAQPSTADIAVSRFDLPATVVAGLRETYMLRVTNRGPGRAFNVSVVESLPPTVGGFSGQGATIDTCRNSLELRTIACLLGSIDAGFSRDVKVEWTPNAGLVAGAQVLLTATASAGATSVDPVPGNNTLAAALTTTLEADLSIAAVVPAAEVAGRAWVGRLDLEHLGWSDASGVVTTIELDPMIAFVSVDQPGAVCTLPAPTLVVCRLETFRSETRRSSISVNGLIRNSPEGATRAVRVRATVTSAVEDPNLTNNSAVAQSSINAISDVAVSLRGQPTVIAGQPIRFDGEVVNLGPSVAGGVSLLLDVGGPVLDLTATLDGVPCPAAAVDRFLCTRVSVPVGVSAAVSITGRTSPDVDLGARIEVKATLATQTNELSDTKANNVATVVSTVTLSSKVELSIDRGFTEVPAGNPYVFVVTVTNSGVSRTDDAALDIVVGGGVYFAFTTPEGCTRDGEALRCAPLRIAAGASRSFNVGGIVAPTAPKGTEIRLTAKVSSTSSPPADPPEVSRVVVVSIVTGLKLVADVAASAVAGETYNATYRVRNDGPSTARGVTFTVDVADPLGVVVLTDSCLKLGQRLICTFDELAPGAPQTISIQVKVPASLTASEVALAYSLQATSSSDSALAGSSRTEILRRADLAVELRPEWQSALIAGTKAKAHVIVRSVGPSDAIDSTVVITMRGPIESFVIPSSLASSCAQRAGTWSCRIPKLVPGSAVEIQIEAPLSPDAPADARVDYSMQVSGTTPDLTSSNDAISGTVIVVSEVNLVTQVTAEKEVRAGGIVKYDITVSSEGPSTARDVSLSLRLPPALSGATVVAIGLECARGPAANAPELRCFTESMSPDQPAKVQIEAVLDKNTPIDTSLDVMAWATTRTTEVDARDNDDPFTSTVTGTALLLREIDNPDALTRVGNTVLLVGRITNDSDHGASDVIVVHDVPVGHRVVSAEIDSGTCDVTRTMVMCAVKTLNAHGTFIVRMTSVIEGRVEPNPMSILSTGTAVQGFRAFEMDDTGEHFVRPRLRTQTKLDVVADGSPFVPKLFSAVRPLVSGLALSAVFGVALAAWVRKGRREDPLATMS